MRSFEAFKLLYLGMISESKRESLPAIAKTVELDHQQNLHPFLSESPILLIDETEECKKGKSSDYVKRQSMGNVGKKESGIVAVTAYGLVDGIIVLLSFEVHKPN